jgi:hypothetical protein
MIQTKAITGKKQIVKSTDELRMGDAVTIMELRGKSKKKKKSLDIYKIVGWNKELQNVMVVIEYDGFRKNQKTVALEDIRLHTIKTLEVHEIVIEFTCREKGLQRTKVSEHDFTSYDQECEICGSHGSMEVDLKCECGKTHCVELKSW